MLPARHAHEGAQDRSANTQRGDVRALLTPEALQVDLRVLPPVDRPGAPAPTRQSFVVDAASPGLQPTSPLV